jgi:hypothetical protein
MGVHIVILGLKAQPRSVKQKTTSQYKNDPVWRHDKVHGKDLKPGWTDESDARDLKITI